MLVTTGEKGEGGVSPSDGRQNQTWENILDGKMWVLALSENENSEEKPFRQLHSLPD